MHVVHGTWIPEGKENYERGGGFYLWVEKDSGSLGKKNTQIHPRALKKKPLAEFMKQELGLREMFSGTTERLVKDRTFTLPSLEERPLKSYELLRYAGEEPPADFELRQWKLCCYPIQSRELLLFLKDLAFLFSYPQADMLLGSDIRFWLHYTQAFKELLLKDQYIPALQYRTLPPGKGRKKKAEDAFMLYPAWEIVSGKYENDLRHYVEVMPQICAGGSEKRRESAQFFSKDTLLRHFSESLLHSIIWSTPRTAKFDKQIADSLLEECIRPSHSKTLGHRQSTLKEYKQWAGWRTQLAGQHNAVPFTLGFQLHEAAVKNDPWHLSFLINSKKDPSLRMSLDDYWYLDPDTRKRTQKGFGKEIEKHVLLNLGQAARMYPKIWDGLETDKPSGFELSLYEAFDFLKEYAWILEDSGYKVMIPSWWTPKGRRKAKIRVKSALKSPKGTAKAANSGLLGLDALIEYQYELSVGGKAVSREEWEELVKAKTPLVKFRGEWMELDPKKMQQMLEFWQTHADEKPEMNMLGLLKMQADTEMEFDHDESLRDMIERLRDSRRFELIPDPPKFQGTLRDYQKRGLSWIHYLEQLGLNGCLADDMGLGKTIQVIARLIHEREEKEAPQPTLLIAPTSVLGNWQKETARFAPHLRTMIHHGSAREKEKKAFQAACAEHDMVISSYALARLDEKLFRAQEWERLVLDEAQNIKNPQAAQTKAILKLQAKHRLALTGTPVENRLLDLWSIFNFLNHGYLGTRAHFRRTFEIPVQKENDRAKTQMLKKLSEPFILRRVKTDKEIIKDLPDKVEQKVYCNLSKEQASLYEAVVKDVSEQIETKEGMERKGLVLSSLMKLKQICNHPAQFLQDNSEFTTERSHKFSRLNDMLEETIENGESLLIFSQFREICESMAQFTREVKHYPTYLIHGGITRNKRQSLIEEFQDPESDPAVFILSLKAGGVGITLTKANHVFHFDRWWNPAVENQATDRAFRIGQSKNVFVHKFIAIGTLEEKIDQMIEDKKALSDAIVGSDESWLTELDNESFKDLIALNKRAVLE
ncbi:MAG: DEAD/DEAH box helicase [bacterium]|nr:DEAD/DEAH box helicase [bacterium]